MADGRTAPHLQAIAACEIGRSGLLKKASFNDARAVYGLPGYSIGREASFAAAVFCVLLSSEAVRVRTLRLSACSL